MSYAWKRSLRAIAVTASTTAAAFLANSFSPMMPVQSFGIYAAIIIPANYFLIVMLFPPAVILYENKFAKMGVCFCCPCGKEEVEINDGEKEGAAAVPANTERSEAYRFSEDKEPSKLEAFF